MKGVADSASITGAKSTGDVSVGGDLARRNTVDYVVDLVEKRDEIIPEEMRSA